MNKQSNLSDKTIRKFEEVIEVPEFLQLNVLSDTGYVPVTHSNKTIPYQVYHVKLSNGMELKCQDTHILINSNHEEVYQKDQFGEIIITTDGEASVISVCPLNDVENMYDLSIDSPDNTYFTDGILSHNTTTFAADVVWDAIFKEDYKIGITSYTNANVKDYMDRIRYVYENLPWWMKPQVTIYNRTQIQFDNDSSITGMVTKENTFRGFSLQRIISDELGFVKPSIADEFIQSLMPSLEGDGEQSTTRFNVISTPKGTEGQFPSMWFGAVSGTNGFFAVEVMYDEIPGRTPEFERKMVQKMGRDKFEQEFKNRFIGSGGTLIRSRILEAIETMEPIEIMDDFEFFTDNFRDRKIGIACDVAEGIGEDSHCMQIFDIVTLEQLGEFANNMMNQTTYTREIIRIINYLWDEGAEDIYYTIEANGIGQGVIRLIEQSEDVGLNRATLVSDLNKNGTQARLGMLTTGRSKLAGCQQLKDLIEQYKMTIHSKKLLTELKFFVKSGQSFQAERGMHDDRVMAVVILCNMLTGHIASYEEEVDQNINEIDEVAETWGISF